MPSTKVANPNAAMVSAGVAAESRITNFRLGAVAFGQFTGYISQYLVTTSKPEFTYQVISSVVAVKMQRW